MFCSLMDVILMVSFLKNGMWFITFWILKVMNGLKICKWFRCGRMFEEEESSVSISTKHGNECTLGNRYSVKCVTKQRIAKDFIILWFVFPVQWTYKWINKQQLMHLSMLVHELLLWHGNRLMSSVDLYVIQENRSW